MWKSGGIQRIRRSDSKESGLTAQKTGGIFNLISPRGNNASLFRKTPPPEVHGPSLSINDDSQTYFAIQTKYAEAYRNLQSNSSTPDGVRSVAPSTLGNLFGFALLEVEYLCFHAMFSKFFTILKHIKEVTGVEIADYVSLMRYSNPEAHQTLILVSLATAEAAPKPEILLLSDEERAEKVREKYAEFLKTEFDDEHTIPSQVDYMLSPRDNGK